MNDLQEISTWCDKNRMVINVKKIMITTQQRWQHLDKTDMNICIYKLQVVESKRPLWLQVDNFLTWKAYVQKTHNTIAGKSALLCRIKKYLPYQARKTFYNNYILPLLLQHALRQCKLIRVHLQTKLQRRAARIVADSEYR